MGILRKTSVVRSSSRCNKLVQLARFKVDWGVGCRIAALPVGVGAKITTGSWLQWLASRVC